MSFIAPEYLYPATDAGLPPTIFQRFGPTLFGPPLVKLWQAAHFLETFLPASALADASIAMIGSGPAGTAAVATAATGTSLEIM